jgi:glycosyltransferase involved in cell wall biosynthesis
MFLSIGEKFMQRLNILIWNVHSAYLNTLAQIEHNWYLPVKEGAYGGRSPSLFLPDYVREVPAEEVRNLKLDLIIFQSPKNYHEDQYEILTPEQRRLPKIYLEHNTPRGHPTNTRHPVNDPDILLVHVTHYNRLMWDNGCTTTTVIEHSVAIDPSATYRGQLDRGITVINSMSERGRLVGYDLFQAAREQVPLDCAGIGASEIGGIGDIPYRDLHWRMADYRFLFSPIRYTSLPLSVIEAMMIGMPIIALATTELPLVIENGKSGYLSNELPELIEHMQRLIANPEEARRLGARAREVARERFGLERFIRDWNAAFALVAGRRQPSGVAAGK